LSSFLSFFLSVGIRRLQMILMKIALIVGVQVFVGVSFDGVREPDALDMEWGADCTPPQCDVSRMAFDVLVGAEGKHTSVPGESIRERKKEIYIYFVNINGS
jgi:hypothetical protein